MEMVRTHLSKVILVAGGGLYAFGKNDNGQLGLQSREWRLSPVRKRGKGEDTPL